MTSYNYFIVDFQAMQLLKCVLEEQDAMIAIKEDASAITSFGSVPLCVISAADKSRFDSFIQDNVLKTEMTKAWSIMQEDMLHLSTDSRQIVVSNGGHYLHQDQPEIMKEAIQAMISRVTANNYPARYRPGRTKYSQPQRSVDLTILRVDQSNGGKPRERRVFNS